MDPAGDLGAPEPGSYTVVTKRPTTALYPIASEKKPRTWRG